MTHIGFVPIDQQSSLAGPVSAQPRSAYITRSADPGPVNRLFRLDRAWWSSRLNAVAPAGPTGGLVSKREKHPRGRSPDRCWSDGYAIRGRGHSSNPAPPQPENRSALCLGCLAGLWPGAALSGRSSCWPAQNSKASGEKPLRGMPSRPRQTQPIRGGWVKLLGLRSLQPPLGGQRGAASLNPAR